MASITVLGPNGLVGRRLLPLLRKAGINTRSAGRSNSDTFFDWSDPKTFKSALLGTDALYLVPPALVAFPAAQVDQLLGVARANGIRRVVVVSSLGITLPTEPEGSGRHQFEDVVRRSGIAWSILRPSGFMQNLSEGFMLPAIQHAGVVPSAAGLGKVAMVDCGDIANVAMAALTRDDLLGRTLEITGPAAMNFAEMIEMISNEAGRPIAYQHVEEQQMAQMMEAAGIPQEYASMLLRDQRAIRTGHGAVTTTTVLQVTGREPKSFQEFARDNSNVWRSIGKHSGMSSTGNAQTVQ